MDETTFKKNSGDAMVALVGVNDELDFSSIAEVTQILEYAREMYYFKKKINEYSFEGKIDNDNDLSVCTTYYNYWKTLFDLEYSKVPKIREILWELDFLGKIATESAHKLRSAVSDSTGKQDVYNFNIKVNL